MSTEKYITEGLVLKKYEQGENDLIFKIFTSEFGIIFVLAKSIRKINSKLRMQVQVAHFLKLTLVKGREVWRLAGARENFLPVSQGVEKIKNTEKIEKIVLVSECLNRFLPMEKPQPRLFARLKELLILEGINLNNFRVLVYYLILVETGYADVQVLGVQNFQEYQNLKIADLQTSFLLRQAAVKDHLKKVLKESML